MIAGLNISNGVLDSKPFSNPGSATFVVAKRGSDGDRAEDVDRCAAILHEIGATIVRGPLEGTTGPVC